ncbi:DUF3084 domain-containing protein [Cyanobium sp. WAJ14-Wanaka]|uniref:DUF3084 domain-containing protein n=1 Tax=Cyanobium sp. WAJ14-Wanaka TaxID=2823725 RepID=UPI0020CF23FB|nr:DUF3084 domain-containing protein [Cyanobium sp. WAJ14-Wanaka]MCP9775846.1 DUF3084 domain-containing protein [Cyanobium sp. WAJ14-Wanaka]
MSGWLLILALLVLGGVLSTLGDRLGSRVGKARLSLFQMRPRRTAVLITVLTGSVISAVSLGLMLLVSERLRVGLFELDKLETRLQTSRSNLATSEAKRKQAEKEQARFQGQLNQSEARLVTLRRSLAPLLAQRRQLEAERSRLGRDLQVRDAEIRSNERDLAQVRSQIAAGTKELKDLETNLIAFRRGDVVISSGQILASAKVKLEQPSQAKSVVTALLQQANLNAFRRVLPGQNADRQILLVPRSDIAKLEEMLAKPGSWVVSLISAANVLRGERQVLAFPDLRPNRPVIKAGEVLASTILEGDLSNPEAINRRLNLLLAAAYARAQRQGTVADGLQVDPAAVRQLSSELSERPRGLVVALSAVAVQSADTPDPIAVELRWDRDGDLQKGGARGNLR